MGELAARTIFSNDTGPLAGTGLDTLAKNQGAILELEGAQAPQSKTIASGSISPTAAYVIVDTEGGAASDDLTAISPVLSASENLHDGMVIYLKAADSGRVVTVKNSTSANGINTYDGNHYALSATHWLKLQLRSGKWYEVEGRAMGTALAAAAAASTPATTTARGIGRVATSADLVDGATITNGPAFLVAGIHASVAAAASKMPIADSAGKLNLGWMRGIFVGDIRLVPFRAADLAANCPGWYYCNGDQYLLTSDVGIALNALPANFKADWGIVVASGCISIPKLFHTDGRGFYVRAVNGTARQVGSVATDKFQGHTHGAYGGNNDSFPGPPYWRLSNSRNDSGPSYTTIYGTDGSNGSPRTGTETSVLDVGMTPAIFLDV